MRPLTKLAVASAWATTLVLCVAAGAKVRIDARAHRLRAESLRAHALVADDVRELEAAGQADASALASFTPFDRTPHEAALSLARTAQLLADRGDARAALRVLDLGIAASDSSTVLYAPLGADRDELETLRDALAGPTRAPTGTGTAPAVLESEGAPPILAAEPTPAADSILPSADSTPPTTERAGASPSPSPSAPEVEATPSPAAHPDAVTGSGPTGSLATPTPGT